MSKKIFRIMLIAELVSAALAAAVCIYMFFVCRGTGDRGVRIALCVLSAAVSACIMLFVSSRAARRIAVSMAAPINAVDIKHPKNSALYPELAPLSEKLETENRQTKKQIEQLRVEHEQRERLRKEFTANVSHELKTPLTSISGFAEIIQNGVAKPEDISRFAGNIYSESQRLITLVGDIMRLSQLDENRISLRKEPVDLYTLSQNVLLRLEPEAAKRGIRLRIAGESSVIYGMEQILNEIVYNLCDNAIKYNKDNGEVRVTVRPHGEGAELSVEDTGIGISEEDCGRIFERFFRVNKSHSKEIGGTGLGLSIVKHGAAVHGAEISVKSRLGSGTIVRISFP